MNAIIIYWSKTGNTERVAGAIRDGLEGAGARVSVLRVEDAHGLDLDDYDLVCVGFPSYRWHPPKPVDEFLRKTFARGHRDGRVQVGAPTVPGCRALLFCTYSGPHTDLREATPAVLYAGQFFEHMGYAVLGEWCIVGEFHGDVEASTLGRLGDIRGRPNEADLEKVRADAQKLGSLLAAGDPAPG
jgi:hypothetical protein